MRAYNKSIQAAGHALKCSENGELGEVKVYLNSKTAQKKRCGVETDGRLQKLNRKLLGDGRVNSACEIGVFGAPDSGSSALGPLWPTVPSRRDEEEDCTPTSSVLK